MDIRQLKYFVGIVEAGSISRAALTLHVAQPALSLHMRRLEAQLGVKLLNRTVRGITPTDAGLAVYQHARLLLRQLDATATLALQADAGPAGPVNLGLPWSVSSAVGLPLLRRVLAELPKVHLRIVEGPSPLLASIGAQGELDVAVVFGDASDQDMRLTPLLEEPLWLVGARGRLKGMRCCTIVEAARFPLVLMSPPNGIREQLESTWAQAGVKPHLIAELNSPSLLIDAIAEDVGLSILPSASVVSHGPRPRLDRLLIDDGGLVRKAYVGMPRRYPPTRAAERVAELLFDCVAEAVRAGRWQASLLAEADAPSPSPA